MRQKRSHSSDTPGTTAPAAPPRSRSGALLTVLLAAACGALVFTYAEELARPWTSLVLTERLRLGLAVDSALLVVALVVIVASARSARRARRAKIAARIAEAVPGQAPLEGPVDEGSAEHMEVLAEVHSDVRVLQAQIRSLEEALAQQEIARAAEAEPVTVAEPETRVEPEPQPATDRATRDEVTREVLHRVRCTVRGLGVRMDGDPVAADILARVDAAVERLAATGLFERPTLSEPDHTLHLPQGVAGAQAFESAPVEAAAPVETAPVETPPAPSAPAPAAPAMRMPFEVPDEEPVVATPAALAADEPEVVLPVPPSPPAPEVHRGRRWLRRSTAA